MRLTERLMYFFGVGLAVAFALEELIWCIVFAALVFCTIIAGCIYDGFRLFQWLFIIVFIPQCLLIGFQEYNMVAEIIFCTVLFFGILVLFIYGEGNFNRVELKGKY